MKIRAIFVCRSFNDVIVLVFFFIRLYIQYMKHDINCISCVTLIAVQRALKKFWQSEPKNSASEVFKMKDKTRLNGQKKISFSACANKRSQPF